MSGTYGIIPYNKQIHFWNNRDLDQNPNQSWWTQYTLRFDYKKIEAFPCSERDNCLYKPRAEILTIINSIWPIKPNYTPSSCLRSIVIGLIKMLWRKKATAGVIIC